MDIEGEESPEERFARLNKGFLREQVYKNATMFLRVESSQEMMYHGVSTKMIFFFPSSVTHANLVFLLSEMLLTFSHHKKIENGWFQCFLFLWIVFSNLCTNPYMRTLTVLFNS